MYLRWWFLYLQYILPIYSHKVYPSFRIGGGGGEGWASNQIFKEGGKSLKKPQLLEGVAGKEGGDFSQGGRVEIFT